MGGGVVAMASQPRCHCLRWAVDIKRWEPIAEGDFRRAIQSIQPEECERISRFRFRQDQLVSMIGRLLLRQGCLRVCLFFLHIECLEGFTKESLAIEWHLLAEYGRRRHVERRLVCEDREMEALYCESDAEPAI